MVAAQSGGLAYDPVVLRRKYLEERDKRLRRDGPTQYLEAAGQLGDFSADPYVKPGFTRDAVTEDVDVVVVGGGFGGLLTGAKLHDAGVRSMRIIEEGGDFGGTWYWNRYPGVRCDIESYCYLPLLEEVGTVPSERYVEGREIFAHCQAIGRRYDLYRGALFQTKVTRIAWDESLARWIVETHRGDVIRARFVTVSQGPLAKVKLPGVPGITTFKGRMFHSSRWDYDYTGGDASGGLTGLANRRVAVIGTAATAVQIVPRLAEHAEQLLIFQRTPSAIDVRNNTPTDRAWFESLPKGWQQRRMDNFLTVISGMPHEENTVADGWTDLWGRLAARKAQYMRSGVAISPPELMQSVDFEKMEELRARVAQVVQHPQTAEALKPWYNYLCKRPLYSDDFLQALNRDNVTLIDTQGRGVEAITETGVVANGAEHPVDCIVFATGFEVGAAAHRVGGYALIGRGGVDLAQKWADGVRTVHGTQISGFPNFHIVGGVAQGTIAFNFTHTLAMQAAHATAIITRCLDQGIRSMEVTPAAEAAWLAVLAEKHVDHQQFYEDCTPGFLNNEGDFKDRPTFVGGTYGGGPVEYERVLERWRLQDLARDTTITYLPDVQVGSRSEASAMTGF